jgi:hypothetical protein
VTTTTVDAFASAVRAALAGQRLACIVAKVEAVGPPATAYDVDIHMLEYRFTFARTVRQPPAAGGKMP